MCFRLSAVFAKHAFQSINTVVFCVSAKLPTRIKTKSPKNFLSEIVRNPGVRFAIVEPRTLHHTIDMAITLPIKRMSREEKLRAMEALWEDLSREESQYESPAWHAKVLRQTERLVRAGKAKFSDWAVAKERIRRKAAKLA